MSAVRKKILYIHHATGRGGAPRSLSFLIAGLDRDEFEPIVVIPKRPGNAAVRTFFENANARVIEQNNIRPFHAWAPINTLGERAKALFSLPHLTRVAKRVVDDVKPDIVHLNSTSLVAAAKGAHLVDPKIPVVAHVREPLLTNGWGRWLAKMNRRHVDWFIGIDQFGLDSIGMEQPRGEVIFNFVDRARFCPASQNEIQAMRRSNGWQDDQVVFLSLARVMPYNGALELAQLVHQCDSQLDPRVKFAFVGFPSEPEGYSLQAKQSIESSNRMQALGFSENVVGLINAADVVIAPFITPHSARSILEAAAIGKPTIVSDLPNLRELIVDGKTGLAFNWDDPESFIRSVNALCDHEFRQVLGAAGLKHAAENFDQQQNTEKTMRVYRRLLEGRTPGG